MDQVNQINRGTMNENSDRIFLYEVVLSSSTTSLGMGQTWQNRRAKMVFKVPYERMGQEMKRIAKLGGTITRITPISELENRSHDDSSFSLPWWIQITTQTPHCLYYFGPFDSPEEAVTNQDGYVEDLTEEGATEIQVKITQGQPSVLTQEWD